MQPDRTIIIAREAFGCRYDVTVAPAVAGASHGREYPTLDEAVGYARTLHLAEGWPITNLVQVEVNHVQAV